MHDRRFSTLREVVEHYAGTVQPHANLGMPLNMHTMNFSEEQREALEALLHTLTDNDMLNDPKFASPFE